MGLNASTTAKATTSLSRRRSRNSHADSGRQAPTSATTSRIVKSFGPSRENTLLLTSGRNGPWTMGRYS